MTAFHCPGSNPAGDICEKVSSDLGFDGGFPALLFPLDISLYDISIDNVAGTVAI